MRGFKFMVVPWVHQQLFAKSLEDGDTHTVVVSAALASAIEGLLISPFEVAKLALISKFNDLYQFIEDRNVEATPSPSPPRI